MTTTEHKIINGIKYFIKHTRNVGRTKLFKLLYFWDFRFFKKYGMSITYYDYYTYPFGPVPKKLYDQIISNGLPDFLNNEISIIQVKEDEDYDDQYKKFKVYIKPGKKIEKKWFTPIELNMLEEIADIFREATARNMTESTHLLNSPWDKTVKQFGYGHPIDIYLALDDKATLDLEEVEEYYNLQKEFCLNGRL